MFTYKRNYTHKEIVDAPLPVDYSRICSRYKHAMEYIKFNVPTRTYFDVELKGFADGGDEKDFELIDEAVLEAATRVINRVLPNEEIISITTSSCGDFNGGAKWSFHFVLAKVRPREVIKGLARQCNDQLHYVLDDMDVMELFDRHYHWFDLKVYNAVQCFRMVGQWKVGEEMFPKRQKRIILGSMADSIVQAVDTPPPTETSEGSTSSQELPFPVSTCDDTAWLRDAYISNNKALDPLISRLCEYDNWLKLAMHLVYVADHQEASRKDEVHTENQTLFRYLSVRCNRSGPSADSKYKELMGKVKKDFGLEIRSWLSVPYSEEIEPYNTCQYRMLIYLSTTELCKGWETIYKNELQSNADKLMSIVVQGLNHKFRNEVTLETYSSLLSDLEQNVGVDLFPFTSSPSKNDEMSINYKIVSLYMRKIASQHYASETIATKFKEISEKPDETGFSDWESQLFHYDTVTITNLRIQTYRFSDNPFSPLLKMQVRQDVMEFLMQIISTECLYVLHVPYKATLLKLWEAAGEDLDMFRFHICRYSQYFISEKFVSFIGHAFDDRSAAKVTYDLYPYWSMNRSSSELYVYDFSTGIWSSDICVQARIISMLSPFLYRNTREGLVSYGGLCNKTTTLLQAIKSLPMLHTKYNFMDLQQTSRYRLLFPNGYYDGTTNEFKPARSLEDGTIIFNNPSIFFFASMPDNYSPRELLDEELIEDTRYTLFYAMHDKDVAEYHIESLACAALAVPHKGFYVHIGLTNSGKSTLKSMIESSFGKMVATGNTDDFALVKDDRRESALVNAFVVTCWFCRFLLFSESTERKLNTELLKQHTSGQLDGIRARRQYEVAALYFVFYVPIFYLNQVFELSNPSDQAIIERGSYFHWNKQYVDKNDITDPTVQIEKRPDVEDWKYDPKRRQMFVHILLDGYRQYSQRKVRLPAPEQVLQSKIEEIGTISYQTNTDIFERILYHFIIDGAPDSITTRAMYKTRCSEIGIEPRRVTQAIHSMISSFGFVRDPQPVLQKSMRVRGVVETVWVGMLPRAMQSREGDYLTDLTQWKALMRQHGGTIPEEVRASLKHVAANFRNPQPIDEFIMLQWCTPYQRAELEKAKRRGTNRNL